jgi:hypothetical protein
MGEKNKFRSFFTRWNENIIIEFEFHNNGVMTVLEISVRAEFSHHIFITTHGQGESKESAIKLLRI